MMKPSNRKLNLKVKNCLINQFLQEYSGLDKVIYQRAERKTGNGINKITFQESKTQVSVDSKTKNYQI